MNSKNSNLLRVKNSFRGGVHPSGHKDLSSERPIEAVIPLKKIELPVSQHIGAACESLVKYKQEVKAGEKIAQSDSFVSAPIHSPVAGTVQRSSVTTLPTGQHLNTIPIKVSEGQPSENELWEDILGGTWAGDLEEQSPDSIVEAVREAGLVGQGGATFPTHVKLMRHKSNPIDTILVNGCECEPYLTADQSLMRTAPEPIVRGALLAARAAGAENILVAIEDNKPKALEAMQKAAEESAIKICSVKTRYPMGGERQTVKAVLGRTIPSGGLPLNVGVVVINAGTAASLANAVLRKKPLTHRVVSVTGRGIANPKNLLAPIGISYAELIERCGGLKPETQRVISGGPMMGFAVANLDAPIIKGTSGIVALTGADLERAEESSCIRCGRCVDVCPLGLVPSRFAAAGRAKNWDLAKAFNLENCMECGSCAYTCPASIPLVQLIRRCKTGLKNSG